MSNTVHYTQSPLHFISTKIMKKGLKGQKNECIFVKIWRLTDLGLQKVIQSCIILICNNDFAFQSYVLVFSGGKSSNDFLSAKAEMWPFFNVILTYFKNNEKSTLLNISHQTKSKRTLFTIRCDQLWIEF